MRTLGCLQTVAIAREIGGINCLTRQIVSVFSFLSKCYLLNLLFSWNFLEAASWSGFRAGLEIPTETVVY
jgi:hypothetical protein